MRTIISHLDWLALVIGTVGTLLWANNGSRAKYAALWWLAASLTWVVYAWAQSLPALGARDFISVALNAYGGWRWLRPASLGGSLSSSPR